MIKNFGTKAELVEVVVAQTPLTPISTLTSLKKAVQNDAQRKFMVIDDF